MKIVGSYIAIVGVRAAAASRKLACSTRAEPESVDTHSPAERKIGGDVNRKSPSICPVPRRRCQRRAQRSRGILRHSNYLKAALALSAACRRVVVRVYQAAPRAGAHKVQCSAGRGNRTGGLHEFV